MLRTLYEPAASVQQPPAERLPIPELVERGNAKTGNSITSEEASGAWGTMGTTQVRHHF
jgi:hypothetical protein